ncbi:hypothetical protein LCGC14_0374410 [marine sediment metagenome]|uniref:Uncharacterized protein n=1 Tax=marine sediment metagenome TaxID=412755 RepID=A0A0F9VRE9_9ZZZZ
MAFEALPRIGNNLLAVAIIGWFAYMLWKGYKKEKFNFDNVSMSGLFGGDKPKMPKFK